MISKLVAVPLSEEFNAANPVPKYTLVLNTPILTFTDLGGLDPKKRKYIFEMFILVINQLDAKIFFLQ